MSTRGSEGDTDLDERALRALVQRAVESDPDAWELLYRRNHRRLFAYARRRTGSDTAADDAVSETMLRALDKIGTFTWRGAGFDAWLSGICRNVVLEAHRRDGRTQATDAVQERADTDAVDPLDVLVREDQATQILTAFDLLSADDQEVLELRVIGGLSPDGVAEATGRRAGAVRMAQSRALRRLRGHYEGLSRAD